MDDYPGGQLGLQLLIIVILTAVNAFFAAAEMAVISANKTSIRNMAEKGDPKAKKLAMIFDEPTRFLSTIQVSITLAGYLSSATAATTISKRLAYWMALKGIPYGSVISVIAITIILSFFTLIFGELVPKRIAIQNADKIALWAAPTIAFVSVIFKPFVSVLSTATSGVLKLTGQHDDDLEERISEEEIKSYIKVGQEQGLFDSAGEEMLISIFDFDDKLAYEIMTPRTDVFMIDIDDFGIETIDEMLASGHSRIPVYEESYDNIVGTVYIKDLFVHFSKNNYAYAEIREVMKEPYFVPESKKIDTLLRELQLTRNYMAILIDEYGGFSGIVTMEDIVEEVVGEIKDEYDEEPLSIQRLDARHYLIDGASDIDDVNDELGLELTSENHETMSGLMIEKLGFIPEEEDATRYSVECDQGIVLNVVKVKDKRVEQLELVLPEEEADEKTHTSA